MFEVFGSLVCGFLEVVMLLCAQFWSDNLADRSHSEGLISQQTPDDGSDQAISDAE